MRYQVESLKDTYNLKRITSRPFAFSHQIKITRNHHTTDVERDEKTGDQSKKKNINENNLFKAVESLISNKRASTHRRMWI